MMKKILHLERIPERLIMIELLLGFKLGTPPTLTDRARKNPTVTSMSQNSQAIHPVNSQVAPQAPKKVMAVMEWKRNNLRKTSAGL